MKTGKNKGGKSRTEEHVDLLDRLKRHPVIAFVILTFLIITGAATLTDSLDKLKQWFGWQSSSKSVSSTIMKSELGGNLGGLTFQRFNPDSSNVIQIVRFDLRRGGGTTYQVGQCPNSPCFYVQFKQIDWNSDPLAAIVTISGIWEGMTAPQPGAGITYGVKLAKGCGFSCQSNMVDFAFEVSSASFESIVAYGALMVGTYEGTGIVSLENECQ